MMKSTFLASIAAAQVAFLIVVLLACDRSPHLSVPGNLGTCLSMLGGPCSLLVTLGGEGFEASAT